MKYASLLFACMNGMVSLIAMEHEKPASNNTKELLLQYISAGDLEEVHAILEKGFPLDSVSCTDKQGTYQANEFATNAIEIKDAAVRFAMLKLLLEYGVNPDHSYHYPAPHSSSTAPVKMPLLSYVIGRFDTVPEVSDEVALFIARKANIEEKDFLGNRPINHAWRIKHAKLLTLLRCLGARSLKNKENDSPSDLPSKPLPAGVVLLLTNIEQYKKEHTDEIQALMEKIEALKKPS